MKQMTLFDDRKLSAPLASRLRPETLEEFAGLSERLCLEATSESVKGT